MKKILNIKESGVRQDLISQTKLLNMIVHYELGNEELLPGLCKSTARYLEKNGYRILIELPRKAEQRDIDKLPTILFKLTDEEVDNAFND